MFDARCALADALLDLATLAVALAGAGQPPALHRLAVRLQPP